MNLITLLNREPVTLTTGKLVYGAEETGALQSAIASARSLGEEHATANERIASAIEEGRKQGYSDGFKAGLEEGREQISNELVRLAQQSQLQLKRQRSTTTQMALEIVRKIVGKIAPDKTLVALAQMAATECGNDEAVSLRVHPSFADSVREQLTELAQNDPASTRLVDVIADAALEECACVLETRHGSVVADLETQLRAIQDNLNENLERPSNG